MKSSMNEILIRRNTIIEILGFMPNSEISVSELAKRLNVSPITIRRDLQTLEEMGKIHRKHGFVGLTELPNPEGETQNPYIEQIKNAIAKKAATFIQNNSTVFINTSSTALKTVDYLLDKVVHIVTNNVHVIEKQTNGDSTVYLTGGEVRMPKEALVGEYAISAILSVNANVAIIGCSGISVENGLSTINMHEKNINAFMIDQTSETVIVVADYRKIGVDSNFYVGKLDKIDILITDPYAPADQIRKFEKAGVQVIQIAP